MALLRYLVDGMTIRKLIRCVAVSSIGQIADRYIWTHPSIPVTIDRRPGYLSGFEDTWLSLLRGDPRNRRLREAVAVAVSTANRCTY